MPQPGEVSRWPKTLPEQGDENVNCDDSKEAAIAFYKTGGFAEWEVNARNVLAEIHGVIDSQKEWALRDAIGIAYTPYNRANYNLNYSATSGLSYSGGSQDIKTLLLAEKQGAITTSYYKALNPGDPTHGVRSSQAQKIYEFSLIVSYGVAEEYFYDTSDGSTVFVHRPESTDTPIDCGQAGPAFFFPGPEYYGIYNYGVTSAELDARGGWPDDLDELGALGPRSWVTPFPPPGCTYK